MSIDEMRELLRGSDGDEVRSELIQQVIRDAGLSNAKHRRTLLVRTTRAEGAKPKETCRE